MTAWRQTAVVLALAAMLVRALLPAGWMPNSQSLASGTPIVICTQTGEQHIVLDAQGNPAPADEGQDDGGRTHPPCAFAAVAALSLPTISAAIAPVLTDAGDAAVKGFSTAVHVAAPRAWRSRAPPMGLSA